MIEDLLQAVRDAKRVYLCGNGGSAANALHIANDLVSMGVRAHALVGDIATLTAVANDVDYSQVFAKQILVYGESGDLLIVLSGSGNSKNIVAALYAAQARDMKTWAIVGAFNPTCEAGRIADVVIRVGEDMQEAEEAQLKIGHELWRRVMKRKGSA